MVERYDYAYKVWHCKLDGETCDYDGECDKCLWAKIQCEEEDLNSQETSNSLEESGKNG